MIVKSLRILEKLKHDSNLFSSSITNQKRDYKLIWLRDNIYNAIALETIDSNLALPTYHAILDLLIKNEKKIDQAIIKKPKFSYQYISPRYNPKTLEEVWEEKDNKQNDIIGLLLFKIADLIDRRIKIIRSRKDKEIIQKLIYYLETIEYWNNKDNGMWEDEEQLHASSIGSCLAGLIKISKHFEVPEYLIKNGKEALNRMLPRETETREADLTLLSLIWPLNIVNDEQKKIILNNIETKLLRNNGMIRFIGDKYYNNGKEAEWCLGIIWLSIIYKHVDFNKYKNLVKKSFDLMNEDGEIPELYFGGTNHYNPVTPYCWAQALMIIALN